MVVAYHRCDYAFCTSVIARNCIWSQTAVQEAIAEREIHSTYQPRGRTWAHCDRHSLTHSSTAATPLTVNPNAVRTKRDGGTLLELLFSYALRLRGEWLTSHLFAFVVVDRAAKNRSVVICSRSAISETRPPRVKAGKCAGYANVFVKLWSPHYADIISMILTLADCTVHVFWGGVQSERTNCSIYGNRGMIV